MVCWRVCLSGNACRCVIPPTLHSACLMQSHQSTDWQWRCSRSVQRVLNYDHRWLRTQPLTKHGWSHKTDPLIFSTFKSYSNSVYLNSDISSFLQTPSKEIQEFGIIHRPSAIIISTTRTLKKKGLKNSKDFWLIFLLISGNGFRNSCKNIKTPRVCSFRIF